MVEEKIRAPSSKFGGIDGVPWCDNGIGYGADNKDHRESMQRVGGDGIRCVVDNLGNMPWNYAVLIKKTSKMLTNPRIIGTLLS